MASRVSQHVIEVLTRTTDANSRVSQHVVETLTRTTDANSRVSQHVVEVLTLEPGTAQLSQVVLELLRANGAEIPLVTTHQPVICIVS